MSEKISNEIKKNTTLVDVIRPGKVLSRIICVMFCPVSFWVKKKKKILMLAYNELIEC